MAQIRPEIRSGVVGALDGDGAAMFIANLMSQLTVGARSQYGPDGTMPARSDFALRCFNELIHGCTSPLQKALGSAGAGYPSDTFVDVLEEEVGRNDLVTELESDNWPRNRPVATRDLRIPPICG